MSSGVISTSSLNAIRSLNPLSPSCASGAAAKLAVRGSASTAFATTFAAAIPAFASLGIVHSPQIASLQPRTRTRYFVFRRQTGNHRLQVRRTVPCVP